MGIKSLLISSAILTGSSAPQSKPSTLSHVLHHRLSSFLHPPPPLPPAVLHALTTSFSSLSSAANDVQDDLEALKSLTAACTLACLSQLVAYTAPTPTGAATTAAAATHGPTNQAPLFGSRDVKVVGMLAGVLGRWGLARCVGEGVLPRSLREGSAKEKGKGREKQREARKIVEIIEAEEQALEKEKAKQERARRKQLEKLTRDVWDLVGLEEDRTTRTHARAELNRIVLPQIFVPLLGALMELGYATAIATGEGEGDSIMETETEMEMETEQWARTALRVFCASHPPTVIFGTLLSLLSSTPSSLPWLKKSLSALLSEQILRPGGVRSLLVVVVGTEEDTEASVGLGKLEMVARLLGVRASRQDEDYLGVRYGKKEAREKQEEEEREAWVNGLVEWIKDVGRKDVRSRLFLRWLDEVGVLTGRKGRGEGARSMLRLQLVLKMVDEFGTEMLSEPEEVVRFVAHALGVYRGAEGAEGGVGDEGLEELKAKTKVEVEVDEERRGKGKGKGKSKEKVTDLGRQGLGLADLKIVDVDEEEEEREAKEGEEDEADGDGEELLEGLEGVGKDAMVITGLTLLLAVFEANEDLNMANTPLLSLIFTRLSHLVASPSPLVAPLAREARLVLTARRASLLSPSSSTSSPTPPDALSASRATYQSALHLLSDPLLPVRAQGLSLLRSLISTRSALLSTDPALLPALLDIFLQSLEDDDSFLYLNAVQGLQALVDSYGGVMVRRLAGVYLGGSREEVRGVGDGERGRRELDKRLRVGEALVGVVQRAGEALAVFVDDLVPALIGVLGTSTLPTPLRASAITILATCIETAPLALVPHIDVLAESCITLLSLESVPLKPRRREPEVTPSDDDEEEGEEQEDVVKKPKKRPEETPAPLAANAKHPSLRRAALVLLAMLFRTASRLEEEEAERAEEGGYDEKNPLGAFQIPGNEIRVRGEGRGRGRRLVGRQTRERARVVVKYVGETDEDALVRYQAGEAAEGL